MGVSSIQRIAYEFAVDNFEEGVHYVEPRFAPQVRRRARLDWLAGWSRRPLFPIHLCRPLGAGLPVGLEGLIGPPPLGWCLSGGWVDDAGVVLILQLLATSGEEMDIIAVLKHVNNGLSRGGHRDRGRRRRGGWHS